MATATATHTLIQLPGPSPIGIDTDYSTVAGALSGRIGSQRADALRAASRSCAGIDGHSEPSQLNLAIEAVSTLLIDQSARLREAAERVTANLRGQLAVARSAATLAA